MKCDSLSGLGPDTGQTTQSRQQLLEPWCETHCQESKKSIICEQNVVQPPLKWQLETTGQAQTSGHPRVLTLNLLLDFTQAVVEGCSQNILKHFLVFRKQRVIDLDFSDFVPAGHRQLHETTTRFPLHLQVSELFLSFLNLLLHFLRLLHQLADVTFHTIDS